MPDAAQIDALFQVDGTAERLVEGRIAGRDALHAGARVIVAIGTGLGRRADLVLPQRLAVEHPQHAGIGGIVVLHRLGVRRHEAETGASLCLGDFGRQDSRGRDQERRDGDGAAQVSFDRNRG